ncbi:putative calcineurin-like phosphoesterase 3 [Elsinoe fawcettii]|nr:putative calcineurin-like phosphoesterase 3 [Elsinoe fawcettii]
MLFGNNDPLEPQPLPAVILRSPLKFLIRTIHHVLSTIRSNPRPSNPSIRIVCISDTHSKYKTIPDGDVLIHAGDLTNAGTPRDIQEQIDWLTRLPHRYKICIAGNHDTWLDPRSRMRLAEKDMSPGKLDWRDVIYLQHSTVTLYFPSNAGRRLKVYGAPQIPACGGPEFAFQYPRGRDAWSETIPADTDVLVTHTPPKYHLDLPATLGCEHLLREIWRVKPSLHVFGHVHGGRGQETLYWDNAQEAYEQACARPDGILAGLINILLWANLVEVAVYGGLGLLWSTLWGGRQSSSRLVNASLTYNNTGRLANAPQ